MSGFKSGLREWKWDGLKKARGSRRGRVELGSIALNLQGEAVVCTLMKGSRMMNSTECGSALALVISSF